MNKQSQILFLNDKNTFLKVAKCLRAQGIGVFFTVKKQKFSTIIYINGEH